MEKILEEVNLGTLKNNFVEQHVDLDNVLSLSDQELIRLGVQTIGDRARLLAWSRKKQQESSSSLSTVVAQERSALFSAASASRRSNSSSSSKSKKAKGSRSWTVLFVCMADQFAAKVPTSTENQILFKAGLGLKKIKLDLDDEEKGVKAKITSSTMVDGVPLGFPQLDKSGGFELMCCTPNCRDLSVIDSCWVAKYLKSSLGGGQAKIYIRPIQKSLSTIPLSSGSTKSLITEKCYVCEKEVLVRYLRTHSWICSDRKINESDSDDKSEIEDSPSTTQPSRPAHASSSTATETRSSVVITISDEGNDSPPATTDSAKNSVEDAVHKTISYTAKKMKFSTLLKS